MAFNGDIFVQKALRGRIFCDLSIIINTGKVIKKQNLNFKKKTKMSIWMHKG